MRERSGTLSLYLSHRKGEERPKDEELCKKRDETGRIPRDKRRRGRRRRRDGGTKEDHAGDYNINKQMSLQAGEFAIQSDTGGGREAESPPTNLEGLRGRSLPLWTSPLLLPRASRPPNFSLSPAAGITSHSLSLPLRAIRAFTYTKLDVHASMRRQRCVKTRSRSPFSRISRYRAP